MSPTDLAVLGQDYATEIEQAADPGAYVVRACERAKAWLVDALEHGDIDQIVELKSQAEAIRVYTMSKQLGRDAELSAAEIVRRAERGLGLAIRRAQEAGEVAGRGDIGGIPGPGMKGGAKAGEARGHHLARPADFAAREELAKAIYPVTDHITEEHFEEAIREGRVEGNLSSRNVVRKVRAKREAEDVRRRVMSSPGVEWIPEPSDRTADAGLRRRAIIREMAEAGYTSRQIAERVARSDGVVRQMAREMGFQIPADEAIGRNYRRIDSNRVVRETVNALEGLAMGIQLVDCSELDPTDVDHWIGSLSTSVRALNRLIREIKKMREETQ